MATPHIVGLAAYIAGLGKAPSDVTQWCSNLAKLANKDKISGFNSDTVNLLGYNLSEL
jgi:hypothetical protein